ncbi:MAG: alkaline phosphatase family protein [Gemmatimonadaceae bacterium]|nr:alkaline phosphatase family protein [Gemmatimonadaceae bacterium]
MSRLLPARARRTFLAPTAKPAFATYALVVATLVATAGAGADTTDVHYDVPAAAATLPALQQRSEHVVIISIDGLRPDAIDKFGAKTLQRLMREGTFTLKAQTILPSKTLPSHTSMLTGVDADQHGITWNTDEVDSHGHVDVPTVFGLAKAQGFHTAAFFSKTKFHHLEAPNTIDYVRSPKGGMRDPMWLAPYTVSLVDDYLKKSARSPNLMFVHIGEPDFAGHLYGWMSGMYRKAVVEADAAVAELLHDATTRFGAGNFTVIVTADHGGHGRNHGSSDPRDTTIPWITWGKGVQAGATLPATVKTMDTAATALWLLGIHAPAEWVGHPVASAFTSGISVAAVRH